MSGLIFLKCKDLAVMKKFYMNIVEMIHSQNRINAGVSDMVGRGKASCAKCTWCESMLGRLVCLASDPVTINPTSICCAFEWGG